jgi:hypothetical protein
VLEIDSQDFALPPSTESDEIGPHQIQIDESTFGRPGRYVLRAQMRSLRCPGMKPGQLIHQISKTFYVNEDPPEAGLFERCEGLNFRDEYVPWRGTAERGSGGGWIYQYNLRHSEYNIAADEMEELTEYLFKLMVEAIFEIDLQRLPAEQPKLFAPDDLESPRRIAQAIAHKTGEIMYEYFQR